MSKRRSSFTDESSDDSSNDSFSSADANEMNQFLMHLLGKTSNKATAEDSDGWSTVESWSTVNSDEDDEQIDENTDEHTEESKCSSNGDRSQWLNALKTFVEKTGVNNLDLGHRDLKREEVMSLFQSLRKSQVTEMEFYGSNLKNGVKHFSKFLAGTKLKTLKFISCGLTNDDLLNLMATVKGSEVTSLNLSFNEISFDVSLMKKFVALLCQSRLTHLTFVMGGVANKAAEILVESLPKTSLTQLNFRALMMGEKCITKLISNLPRTAVTDLNLCGNRLSSDNLKLLSEVLKDSKLEKLNLHGSSIRDAGVNVLIEGLVHSKITDLTLSLNKIKGRNNLGHHLKSTKIKTLDLSSNEIKYDDMFNFPEFLKGSSVKVLYLFECFLGDEIGQKLIESLKSTEVNELFLGYNDFGSETISKFCKSVRFTNITEVHFSSNALPCGAVSDLGNCLKESKLKTLGLYETFGRISSHSLAQFIEKTKGSSLISLDLSANKFKFESNVAKSLENTTFTHIELSEGKFSPADISNFGAALKSTAITHLNLNSSEIGDESMEILAKCLIGTQVVSLDVSRNSISTVGAKALADALKDTNLMSLTLDGNQIGDEGFYYLAEKISSSFVTVVDAGNEYGSRKSLIALDKALWENKKIVQALIDSFKRIIPEANNNNFRFDSTDNSSDYSSLLDNCLLLYDTIVKRPSAVTVLAQEESFALSKSQIRTLMFDEFPVQFAMFVGRSVEADVAQHVSFLKKVEELSLNNVTELLLLNRPLYVIDKDQDILHPFVYKLMHKFKQPIVNSSIKPGAEEKLIKYFTNHEELEGASDIIDLLRKNASAATQKDQNI